MEALCATVEADLAVVPLLASTVPNLLDPIMARPQDRGTVAKAHLIAPAVVNFTRVRSSLATAWVIFHFAGWSDATQTWLAQQRARAAACGRLARRRLFAALRSRCRRAQRHVSHGPRRANAGSARSSIGMLGPGSRRKRALPLRRCPLWMGDQTFEPRRRGASSPRARTIDAEHETAHAERGTGGECGPKTRPWRGPDIL